MLALIDMYKAPQKKQDIVVMNKEWIPCFRYIVATIR